MDPADAAAWALDAQPHPTVDLAEHLPGCAACQNAVRQVGPARTAAEAMRLDQPTAPLAVTARAVGRIRVEATVAVLARTLGGAFIRVAEAAYDYLPRSREKGSDRA